MILAPFFVLEGLSAGANTRQVKPSIPRRVERDCSPLSFIGQRTSQPASASRTEASSRPGLARRSVIHGSTIHNLHTKPTNHRESWLHLNLHMAILFGCVE
jgi:hypothetical protein